MSLVFGFNPVLAIVLPIAINAVVGAVLMKRAG
jgi:lipopolysaccharide export system permease protein